MQFSGSCFQSMARVQLHRCGWICFFFLRGVGGWWFLGSDFFLSFEILPALNQTAELKVHWGTSWVLLFCCFFSRNVFGETPKLGGAFKYVVYFHCYLGKIPILTICLKGVVQPPTRKNAVQHVFMFYFTDESD